MQEFRPSEIIQNKFGITHDHPSNQEVAILREQMSIFRQRRVWFWIALAAIVVAFVILIVSNVHGNSLDQSLWFALLPAIFVGLLAPLSILPLFALLAMSHASEAPALAPLFQRPPPAAITSF